MVQIGIHSADEGYFYLAICNDSHTELGTYPVVKLGVATTWFPSPAQLIELADKIEAWKQSPEGLAACTDKRRPLASFSQAYAQEIQPIASATPVMCEEHGCLELADGYAVSATEEEVAFCTFHLHHAVSNRGMKVSEKEIK